MASTRELAPSEIVLLHGEHFTGYSSGFAKLNSAKVPLPASDGKALSTDLGFAVLAAAIFSAEAAGDVRLAVGEKKAFFGLRKKTTVFVTAGSATTTWPEGSLEARTRDVAAAAEGANRPLEVDGLAAALIAHDSTDAWHEAVQRVQDGLHARGLLTLEEERRLKVFKVPRYRATPDALALAKDDAALARVQTLLADAKEKRPELWALFVKEIKEAVARRTERDDDFDFDD